MNRRRSLHSAEPLAHRGAGIALLAVLVGDDLERRSERIEKFAGREKEIRIARPAQLLVPMAEGLDDEYATGGEASHKVREVGPVEIIHDHNSVESLVRERPCAGLEIERKDLQSRRVREAARVDVYRDHLMANGPQGARVPSMTGGNIQNPAARTYQAHPAQNPGRLGDGGVGGSVETRHFGSISRDLIAREP